VTRIEVCPRNPDTVSLTVSVSQAAKLLGVSRDLVYELVAQGELPALRLGRRIVLPRWSGRGWMTARNYCEGDRILLHATVESDGTNLHNGDVVTVEAVTNHGMLVRGQDGSGIVLDDGFVRGSRADGSPNVSHAWARTIDGAQGGTWDQVHLLGSPSLDHQRGYVGLSRGRLSTHTWYVGNRVEVDHGGHVVEPPTAIEAVGEALQRDGAQRFAASADPYRTERLLLEERQWHTAAVATGSIEQMYGDPSSHRMQVARIDWEIGELWAKAVLSAVHEGDPLAFGKSRFLLARRHIERALECQESPTWRGVRSLGREGRTTAEPQGREWTVRDLMDLEFPRTVPHSPVSAVLDSRRRRPGSQRRRDDGAERAMADRSRGR
jgi:excisionase family DNA binding protein